MKLVAGGWWLVAGGWWLVAGGWWLVAGGCSLAHKPLSTTMAHHLKQSWPHQHSPKQLPKQWQPGNGSWRDTGSTTFSNEKSTVKSKHWSYPAPPSQAAMEAGFSC
jgi:hypothetical protein